MKPLLPSLKEKKRYLSFDIISEGKFSVDDVSKAVISETLSFLGTFGSAKAGIMFLKDKYNNNKGIIKTSHKYVDKVRTSLSLIKEIDNKEVIFRTNVVSGILKKAVARG